MSDFQLRLPSMVDAFAAIAKTAAPSDEPGIYASMQLSADTKSNIMAWAKRVGISNRMNDPKTFHCTTVYSRTPFSFDCLDKCPITARFMHYKILGDTNASTLVVHLASPFLHKVFGIRRANGMAYDYPHYIPHISLGKGFDVEEALALPLMTFPCLLTHETHEQLDDDKANKYGNVKTKAEVENGAAQRIRAYLLQHEVNTSTTRDNKAPIRRQHRATRIGV
jgi:hypothetical protein